MTELQRRYWNAEAAKIEKQCIDHWAGPEDHKGFYGSFVMHFAKRYADARVREANKAIEESASQKHTGQRIGANRKSL